ncbi:cadherin-related family member 1-like [Cyprinus carpio]|uniref:Cadherin-related family member 1-like n=1 Tax=Cyprinus carpio TaxID=7962 RepID=A0A9Q9WWB6_CYPCA|nr:cadherin-related family member 1-like [Cyprinus carpio]
MKSMRKKQILILLIALCMSMAQSDFAPYFYDNGAGSSNGNMALFSISEDTSIGTHVYTLNGSDPEGEPVTYGMTFDKGSKEYFSVEPKSGNVTLIQTLDREVQDEIIAFVTITDGRNKVVENVRVFITDANDEKPEFLNLPLIVDVPEDKASGSSIYRVQAVDRDLGSGGSVSYYLQSMPSTKFTIDGHSGVLRIRSGESLDYELSRTHFVTVVAKDGGGKYHGKYQVMTSTAIITINVLDTQDSPPVFVGTPYFGFVYEVSVPGSEIFTVFAKDGDQNNPNAMHYSILSGSDGFFSINSSSGCISLTSFPVQLRNELYDEGHFLTFKYDVYLLICLNYAKSDANVHKFRCDFTCISVWHVPKAVFQLLFWGEKDYEVSVIRLRTHGDAELLDGRSARVLLSVQLCFTDVSVDLWLF